MDKNKHLENYKGLTDKEVLSSRKINGENRLFKEKKESLIIRIIKIFKEPMFLLLLIASSIYFILGEYSDGIIMLVFVLAICLIEYIQESKTDKAIEELNKLSSLNVKVIRNSKEVIIRSEEVVVGDIVILEEGDSVPADGKILYLQGLGVDESSLTGESSIVYKSYKDNNDHFKLNMCYMGTNVVNGIAIIEIISVGKNTELGVIGKSLCDIKKEKTLLEKQVNKLVFVCTIISMLVFIFTMILTYFNNSNLILKTRIIESILAGVTIAMATIPEEIPVILTVFLAMGAWDLTKEKTLTKNMKVIETLGAVNVLCTDKTGTLTENKMVVQEVYSYNDKFSNIAYLSCPSLVYDPMEVAIKDYFKKDNKSIKKMDIKYEYTFSAESKMTGLLFTDGLLCVKGAYESILPLCNLSDNEYNKIKLKILEFSNKGYRVLAIASAKKIYGIPDKLENIHMEFSGLIALDDPLRKGVQESLEECYQAGIRVIMITGDNGDTAKAICKKLNFLNGDQVITGAELEEMDDLELYEKVKNVNIFARVYPNHKMRIVKALQKDNKVVAMTGDGINDAPALKKADVGISMGKRGTNVAKEASDLILLDDNFNTIVSAISNGRNIYKNIKKAISYIIVIHIPIALLSLFVPLFKLPTFLLPIHIMLLELLIDPISSILFQRIKKDKNIMKEKPRKINSNILDTKNIIINLLQGILIFVVVFLTYLYLIKNNYDYNLAITVSYSILILSIVLVAYQLKDNNLTIISYINSYKDKISLIINILVIIGLFLLINIPFINNIANMCMINLKWIFIILLLVLIAILPFDFIKLRKRR